MDWIRRLAQRNNRVFLLLAVAELIFLGWRFAGDYHVPEPVILGAADLHAYHDSGVEDEYGVRVENFTGTFAVTRWAEVPVGSYQMDVYYQNTGSPGHVSLVREVIPKARLDTASLPTGGGRVSFSLWMPYSSDITQVKFDADCAEGEFLRVTEVQLIPTHAWAYTRFLNLLVFFVLADWALLLATRRLPLPVRTVKGRYSAMAVLAITAFACLPLGLGYLSYAHDMSIHLTRIEGLAAGLRAGQFPVRMDPDIVQGRGYPFSLMYSDLFLYPSAVLRVLGYPLQTVYQLYVAAVTLATACITRFVLRRMLGSESLALLGTGLYVLSYYRLSNIFVRGAVGEYTAMVFLPLVVYGLRRIFDEARPGTGWLWLALGFTGILQSHLLTTEMAGLFTLLFCLAMWRKTFTKPVFTALCKAAGTAVLWNLWFLVPLLQYMAGGVCKVKNANDMTMMVDKAVYPTQIFMMFGRGGGYAESLVFGMGREMPATVGAVLAFGALLLPLALLDPAVRRQDRTLAGAGTLAFGFAALALWMSTTAFPWMDLQLMGGPLANVAAKLQFPWRFLSLATVLLVVCILCALALFRSSRPELFRMAVPLLLVCTLIPAGQLLYEVCAYSEVNRYNGIHREEAVMERSTGRSDVVSYMSLGAISTLADQVGGGEYLPADMENTAYLLTEPLIPEEVAVAYRKDGLTVTMAGENHGGDAVVTLPLLAYPGYTLSGEGAALSRQDGYLTVLLPAGWQGTVTVRWTGLWYWRLSDLVSLAAIAATVVVLRRKLHKISAL